MGNFSSNNIWMPLSIVGFAGCLAKSGLLSRIAFNVFKIFPGSYSGTVLATGAASLVLTPLVPSTSAKLGVLSPFTAALAEEAGIQPHSRAMKGLWFTVFKIAYICAFCVLTGSNGNFLILGFAPEDQAATFTWGYWFLMSAVWLIIMCVLTVVFVLLFMKPEKPVNISKEIVNQKLQDLGPMSGDEKFCITVLLVAVALWITESFHGINTTVVAWGALVSMILRGLFTSKDISGLPWQFFMFLAGLLGMADYMGACGLSDWITQVLTPVVSNLIPNSFVFVVILVRLILVNPAQGCKLPKLEKKEMRILPQEKIGMYLAEADRRGLLAVFYLELTTGLRRGELLALLWTDLDADARTISITKQVNRIKGELVVSPPKTQNSIRTLAIPQQAVDLLVEEHKKHLGNPYMFPSPKTGSMYDPDAFRRTHDKILKTIGAEHVRFHDMRHLFATLSLKNGVDVKTLSGALGHYSAGFTLNTYTHATAQMKQDAADTIGAVISSQM